MSRRYGPSIVGIVEVEKARSVGYFMLNDGCAFEYDFQDEVSMEEVVEVELVEVVLEAVVEMFVGACTRSRIRKTAAIIVTMTSIMMDVFDFIVFKIIPKSQCTFPISSDTNLVP